MSGDPVRGPTTQSHRGHRVLVWRKWPGVHERGAYRFTSLAPQPPGAHGCLFPLYKRTMRHEPSHKPWSGAGQGIWTSGGGGRSSGSETLQGKQAEDQNFKARISSEPRCHLLPLRGQQHLPGSPIPWLPMSAPIHLRGDKVTLSPRGSQGWGLFGLFPHLQQGLAGVDRRGRLFAGKGRGRTGGQGPGRGGMRPAQQGAPLMLADKRAWEPSGQAGAAPPGTFQNKRLEAGKFPPLELAQKVDSWEHLQETGPDLGG